MKYAKKKCRNLDLKVMVIFSASDKVIPASGIPWSGSYGRGDGPESDNNDVDADGFDDIIEIEVDSTKKNNRPNWIDSHLADNIIYKGAEVVGKIKRFFKEAE